LNRRSKYPGVTQRCRADCPDPCRRHSWSYYVELPAGHDGKRRQVTRGGYRSAKLAAEARAAVVAKHRAGTLADDSRLTVEQWLRKHYAAKAARGDMRPSYAATVEILLDKYVIPKVGGYRLGQLRGHHLTAAYSSILSDRAEQIRDAERRNERWARANPGSTAQPPYAVPRQLSASTIARIHAVVSGALTAAVKASLVPVNVASAAELPKASAPRVRPWSPETFAAFLAAIEGERLHPFYVVAGFSGLRRGELAGLQWENVHLDAGRLVVTEQRISVGYQVVTGPPKSDAGDGRRVWMAGVVVDTLRAWRRQQAAERLAAGPAWVDTGLVFTDELGNGYHPEHFTKLFARLARKHGLPPARLHSLRHLAASLLINAGVDIASVSKLIGHSSITITSDTYGHLFDAAGRDAAERAAALVDTARPSKIPSIP
jgi:integrase